MQITLNPNLLSHIAEEAIKRGLSLRDMTIALIIRGLQTLEEAKQ